MLAALVDDPTAIRLIGIISVADRRLGWPVSAAYSSGQGGLPAVRDGHASLPTGCPAARWRVERFRRYP